MPGWADATVSFMLSGGYDIATSIPQVRIILLGFEYQYFHSGLFISYSICNIPHGDHNMELYS